MLIIKWPIPIIGHWANYYRPMLIIGAPLVHTISKYIYIKFCLGLIGSHRFSWQSER